MIWLARVLSICVGFAGYVEPSGIELTAGTGDGFEFVNEVP